MAYLLGLFVGARAIRDANVLKALITPANLGKAEVSAPVNPTTQWLA
jgi:hypothetical protein